MHDSGLFEIDKVALPKVAAFFRRWFTDDMKLRLSWLPVPFEIDIKTGPSYADLTRMPSN